MIQGATVHEAGGTTATAHVHAAATSRITITSTLSPECRKVPFPEQPLCSAAALAQRGSALPCAAPLACGPPALPDTLMRPRRRLFAIMLHAGAAAAPRHPPRAIFHQLPLPGSRTRSTHTVLRPVGTHAVARAGSNVRGRMHELNFMRADGVGEGLGGQPFHRVRARWGEEEVNMNQPCGMSHRRLRLNSR